MASKVVDICKKEIVPEIEKLGYFVDDIDFSKKVDGWNLTFYIDNETGINIEDCEKVHKIINEKLDESNPTGDMHYILNVSSIGIDKPVKNHRDFLRNKNKIVDVKLYSPIDSKKLYTGILVDWNEDNTTVEVDGKNICIDNKKIALILPVIKF